MTTESTVEAGRWQAETSADGWQELAQVEIADTALRPGIVELAIEQFALTASPMRALPTLQHQLIHNHLS